MPRDADNLARDLLKSILMVEPNLRLTIDGIMKKPYFKEFDWDRIRDRDWRYEMMSDASGSHDDDGKFGQNVEPPYKPNPNAFKYLLNNNYELISNLDGINDNSPSPLIAKEPNSGGTAGSPRKRVLGDFTMYKLNKEFENF